MIGKSLNLQEKVTQFCRKFLSKILSDFDMIHYYYEYRIYYEYTGCPTQRLTTSDQILKIEKSHMAKSKPCFKILE